MKEKNTGAPASKKRVAVIGASGYTGSQLSALLDQHPLVETLSLYVSQNSKYAGNKLSELYPGLHGVNQPLQAMDAGSQKKIAGRNDFVFLATSHQVSHDLAPVFLDSGAKVIDLSGAFRLKDTSLYEKFYAFEHKFPGLLQQRAYGIPEWSASSISESQLVSAGGCYATAAQLALLPFIKHHLSDSSCPPVVNGFSGVSGAGKSLVEGSLFCEVSLGPYNVFRHRHQPEIEQQCETSIIFTPHICPFKRGLMVNCTIRLKKGLAPRTVDEAFYSAYKDSPFILFSKKWPRVDDVAGSPYCHLHWEVDKACNHAIVVATIDNLLKGAASQAVQCFNLMLKTDETCGLLPAYRAKTSEETVLSCKESRGCLL